MGKPSVTIPELKKAIAAEATGGGFSTLISIRGGFSTLISILTDDTELKRLTPVRIAGHPVMIRLDLEVDGNEIQMSAFPSRPELEVLRTLGLVAD